MISKERKSESTIEIVEVMLTLAQKELVIQFVVALTSLGAAKKHSGECNLVEHGVRSDAVYNRVLGMIAVEDIPSQVKVKSRRRL